MAIIKCKMCGGELVLIENQTVAECEYCGSRQTVPTVDNEKKLTLFARANRLRAACEFDKAAGIYETVVAEFPEEAEAYWGLVLCKYGIEYVDDPATGKKIPTCHRSSFESLLEDSDFEQTLENADVLARRVYREEAKQIEELRREIIAVSANEEPYDIFICYKETDEHGGRTLDSVLAQDIYDALTEKGYRTFFSRITLEDKLGREYEPYIFAALNSAKIMLAVGTDYEFYNAVWVKNEWSRFLKLMAKDKSKYLIPCYKGIDAYDMPREFTKLQAQDLGRMGAIQDILRGVEKLLPRKVEIMKETVILQNSLEESPTEPLLRRAFLFLEDGNWSRADEYCEKVLDMAPESAAAYLGKLLSELHIHRKEELVNCTVSFAGNDHYRKVLRFADPELKAELETALNYVVSVAETIKNSEIETGILKKYRGNQRRVVIPRSVSAIGKQAFLDCVSLRTVEIPDSVTNIASGVFAGCVNLNEIRLSEDHPHFLAAGTCLVDRKNKTVLSGRHFQDMPGDGSIRCIGDRAFYGSETLTDIRIPEGVTHIGREAFAGCGNLQSVMLTSSLISIAPDAFAHNPGIRILCDRDHPVFRTEGSCLICRAEKTVVFGTNIRDLPRDDSVTGIGENAFAGCEMPEHLEIPGNITRIGANAFSGCSPVTSVTFQGRSLDIGDNAFDWAGQSLMVYAFADSDGAKWARKNGLSTKENQEMQRISTAAFLDQGNAALKTGDWAKAGDLFKNALSNDSGNAGAYIGKALVQERCHSLGALIRKHCDTYQYVSTQKLYLEEDTEHINEMAARYSLPGYVEEKTIRELYRFDLSYSSEVAGRQKQYRDAVNWWENHRQLSRAEKCAVGDLAEELRQEKAQLLARMEQRTQNARKDEAWNIHQVSVAYAAHIGEADKAAERIHNEGVALREQHYQSWLEQMDGETDPKKLKNLAEQFSGLGNYRDSRLLAERCGSRAAEAQEKLAAEKERLRAAAAQKKKARRKRARPIIGLIAVITAVCLVLTGPAAELIAAREIVSSVPLMKYLNAKELAENGQYEAAAAEFNALGDYKDAAERGNEASYCWAEELFAAEQYGQALSVYEKLDSYRDSGARTAECEERVALRELAELEAAGKLRQAALGYYNRGQREKSLELWNMSADRESVSVGFYHTVGLRNDGTVVAAGSNWDYKKRNMDSKGQCDVASWEDIVDIEAGDYHTVGLKSDGTVVATGLNTLGQCDVSQWTDIVAVAAGHGYTAGLRADGTVLVAGDKGLQKASSWTDIIALAGGDEYILGLKADGTTTSTRPNSIATRENVIKIAAGIANIFLHEDGTVSSPYSTFTGLTDVADVFAGSEAAICRRTDGSLCLNLVSGWNDWGTSDYKEFRDWSELEREDIVAFSADNYHAVILRADGTVAARGKNEGGRCDVSQWSDIRIPQSPAIGERQSETERADFTESLQEWGKTAQTAIAFGKEGDYARSSELWEQIASRESVSAGMHTVGIRSDGRVTAVGDNEYGQCNVSAWKNIVAVSANNTHTVGLKADGTVVAAGRGDNGMCDVSGWRDIVDISAGSGHTVGLKSDGTVVAVGWNGCEVSDWRDIADISAGGNHTVGVRTDGTVIATGMNDRGQCDVSDWQDIIAVSAGYDNTAGLKSDGTVVVTGNNQFGQCNVSDWQDIVAISTGSDAVVGLKSDGTVVAAGRRDMGMSDVSGWQDIVAVSARWYHRIGIKSDGTLVAAGANDNDRCNVSGWTGIKIPATPAEIFGGSDASQEAARTAKESGIALMENWQYDEAVAAFKEAEAHGADCSTEIQKCEQAMLTQKSRAPYVTAGEPIGQETTLGCRVRGKVSVHKFTRVELDNECVRYTVGCVIPEEELEFILFFDSSHGLDTPRSSFWYLLDEDIPSPGRHTFVFDVRKEDAAAANEMSIRFGYTDNWIIVNNPY